MAIENIHSGTISAAHRHHHSVLQSTQHRLTMSPLSDAEMYSLLLETYIKDPQEKTRLFHAIDNIPAIQRKAEWAMKWIQRCTRSQFVAAIPRCNLMVSALQLLDTIHYI